MTRLWLLLLLFPLAASAHKPSDSYLSVSIQGRTIHGQWDIALRDLEHAIGIDGNVDGVITWGELRASHGVIAGYAMNRLAFSARGKPCNPEVTGQLVDRHGDGAYTVLRFSARCPYHDELKLEYKLLFEHDPTHRGLLRIDDAERSRTHILSPERPSILLRSGIQPRQSL